MRTTCTFYFAAVFLTILAISFSDDQQPNAKSKFLMTENEEATLLPFQSAFEDTDYNSKNDSENVSERSPRRTNKTRNFNDIYKRIENDEQKLPFYGGLEALVERLIESLEDNSAKNNNNILNNSSSVNMFDEEDRCQKWLNNREKIERAFPGSVLDLPACPCLYPNYIFYNNIIWDKKRRRKFRWRDASSEMHRHKSYKRNATYCVRTLPAQLNGSAVAQHCCYDSNRRLITRGSGAATPFIVSPDTSFFLHDRIDLLPWRLCKGDFTRYNAVRVPNNDNKCKVNPDDEEYEYQVKNAKNY